LSHVAHYTQACKMRQLKTSDRAAEMRRLN